MLVIKVKENESIERALRRYKRKVKDTKLLQQVRGREFYEKPSITRRNELLKAAYKGKKQREMESPN